MSTTHSPDPCETALLQEVRKISSTSHEKVQMKKELGLLEGVAIILGIIFGSGKQLFKL